LTPSVSIPTARYTGRFATTPSRIFTISASMKTTGYTGSSGRLCHSVSSSTTASVTGADQVRADVDVVHLPQVGLDVAGGHPTPIQGDDAVVEPVQPGLALPHDPRVEGAVTVPRNGQLDRADLGQQPLRGAPVPAVARAPTGRVVLVIAQMDRQLLTQSPLEHGPGELGQQPVRAEEFHPLGVSARQQLVGELVIDHRRRRRLPVQPLRHGLSVRHHVLPPEPRCGPESSHVTYTDDLTHPRSPLL